ncbi:succinate-semialdehyde dehydrogenase (NADP+) [Angomonas deanei]|nr:succinate-semialdehyde dehydrogenase (NADP+) [Angomonas deanei]|eukprot:EPY41822.1 succinate-semialdehyde dehydrogenase (NADP+) [Angomonas deanei]
MSAKVLQTIKNAPFDWKAPAKYAKQLNFTKQPVNFINGEWVTATTGTIPVEDPCTNDIIGHIPNFHKAEADSAIAAAATAFESWKDTMPSHRAKILRKWAALMNENAPALGSILSREGGKVLAEGTGEVLNSAVFVDFYASEGERVYGDIIPGPRPGVQTTVIKQPIGVVGLITPWNFPSSMITRAAAGAVAAGCTVVLKPSELTPFSALALAQISAEAGLPPGVFNVVTGDSTAIGSALTSSFDVRKISFTGSTRVGKLLYEQSAGTMKKLGLELGGNAPFIVFDDAELERAAEDLLLAKWRNAGQTCICTNRCFVQANVFDQFLAILLKKVKTLKVGNAFDPSAKIGAMCNKAAVDRMVSVVADARKKGGRIECGGRAVKVNGKGHFFEPTVITNVNHSTMDCCQKELFGPVLPVVKFDTEEEVVQLANSTRAGLASYFYTQDYRKQHRVSRALKFGMVGCNESAISHPVAPFGGVKESGLGRDGSKYGIEPFLDIKYVCLSTK